MKLMIFAHNRVIDVNNCLLLAGYFLSISEKVVSFVVMV